MTVEAAVTAPRKESESARELVRPSTPDAPAGLGGEGLEEGVVIGALGSLPDALVEDLGVVADEDAPAVGLDPVENDPRRCRGRHRGLVLEASRALDRH